MKLVENDYALFDIKNNFNTRCFVKGPDHVPRTDGVVVYLNGGDDLSTSLSRVEKAGDNTCRKRPSSRRKLAILQGHPNVRCELQKSCTGSYVRAEGDPLLQSSVCSLCRSACPRSWKARIH